MEAEVITILIVDDHPVVRLGLKTMLATEDGLRVIGMAGSGKEALAEVRRSKPDVVLMDLRMPEMEGVDAIMELRRIEPDLDRKSTRLNSSHLGISYAVFFLKKS